MDSSSNNKNNKNNKRVLSIQSHVVYGYVGNKAAVFPLQLLGFDVDSVNSVHFSCHTGYKFFPHGEIMNGDQLRTILQGLESNGLLGTEDDDHDENNNNNNNNDDDDSSSDNNGDAIGSILTGYIGSVSFLEAVVQVIETVRKYNPNARFVCDPVLGDNGRFYVPKELVDVYRNVVIPKADCVTPNQFETEQLTGIEVKTIDDARKACEKLHQLGPSVVFITSLILVDVRDNDSDNDNDKQQIKSQNSTTKTLEESSIDGDDSRVITIIASKRCIDNTGDKGKDGQKHQMWRIDCPLIPGSFTGTGDVTASLLLGHLEHHPDDLPLVMEKVINTMYVLIRRTHEAKRKSVRSKELRLIQSKDIIEHPPSTYKAKQL